MENRRNFLKKLGLFTALTPIAVPSLLGEPVEAAEDTDADYPLLEMDRPFLASHTPSPERVLGGLIAAENIEAGMACTITSEGKVRKAAHRVETHKDDRVFGYSVLDCSEGRITILYEGTRWNYSETVEIGKEYYLSTVPGRLTSRPRKGQTYIGIGNLNGRITLYRSDD